MVRGARIPYPSPLICILVICGLAGCQRGERSAPSLLDNPAAVTTGRLLAAPGDGAQWITHGGDYSGQRFSRLRQIDAGNVARLHLSWSADYGTRRGQYGAPLYIDGVIYVPEAGDELVALDARTGKPLWRYDARPARELQRPDSPGGIASRGIAAYHGRIIMGTTDARLVAIDARTGGQAWSTEVLAGDGADAPDHSAITMAPRIAQGKVFAGGWSSEAGVRGWMAAFDADTGRELWRFHNVPGDAAQGFANEAMKRAAMTWNAGKWSSGGGVSTDSGGAGAGGAVGDGAVYDAQTGYLIYGTGGTRGNDRAHDAVSGDHLYTASIIALKADNGEYVWHFQATPAGSGNHPATNPMMTMDVLLDGKPRHVLAQPNANGFLYLLDVVTGELLGADAFTEAGERDGRGWHVSAHGPDSAYSPDTGLMYITADKSLQAWNPVARKMVWQAQHAADEQGGGALATAGGLVFSGVGTVLQGHDAGTGLLLWSHDARSAIQAPPISYELDGQQYVAVSVGGLKAGSDEPGSDETGGEEPRSDESGGQGMARLLVFALDDGAMELDQQRN